MKLLLGSTLVLASLTAMPPAGPAQEPSIAQLDWLIGEWSFEDAELEGDYRESGTRICEYVLGGDYIACESRGVSHRGRDRQYLWYFNYNEANERFEVTCLFEGFSGKLLYTATVHDNGRRLELNAGSWEGDRIVVDGTATVTYDGADRYVWATERFRDVATRR